jgi:hypothetical protein
MNAMLNAFGNLRDFAAARRVVHRPRCRQAGKLALVKSLPPLERLLDLAKQQAKEGEELCALLDQEGGAALESATALADALAEGDAEPWVTDCVMLKAEFITSSSNAPAGPYL